MVAMVKRHATLVPWVKPRFEKILETEYDELYQKTAALGALLRLKDKDI